MGDITTSFVQQYKAGITLLNQQEGSRLLPFVRRESQQGEAAYYDQLAPVGTRNVTQRLQPVNLAEADHRRRQVTLANVEADPLAVDRFDEARFLNNPQGEYARSQAMAIGRGHDEIILAAAIGSANTGKTGATAVTLAGYTNTSGHNGGSQIIVDGSEGLSLAKLRLVRRLVRGSNVMDPIVMAITAAQMDDLLTITQVTSRDFNSQPAVLVEGKVTNFMGINFVETELVPLASAGVRACVAWVKPGVLFASNPEMQVHVDRRTDLTGAPIQLQAWSICGATRMHEEWVVQVNCAE